MSPIVSNEDEWKQQTMPKLTMKMLYERVKMQERENTALKQRVESVERQLTEQQLLIGEVAVTADRLMWSQSLTSTNELFADAVTMNETSAGSEMQAETAAETAQEAVKYNLNPRSERQVAPKRKFLWFF
ncbi:hypothetical protein SAMN03159341_101351 [Paenibacillus sp. 1_12]|uniref:hypothetical protein n=1 Tax=Paenibacillus sp. 1_12 TaxID=1566278 RepID=UPI0008EBDE1F|nr:hypothetical protein [Paenibacillus sp. 1_12]SFK73984.1 hypothetical protein SAMN03159341_101351 [Paenibacillus sp. 1_12]